ncbi:MAG: glycosyltransferase family 39 protein [Acidobacteriota bacterium]
MVLVFAGLAAFFADFHPRQGRFYDERFALQNVHSVLQRGALEPANGYYPTLSYLPQTLALGAIEALGRGDSDPSLIYRPPEPPPANASPEKAGRAFMPLAYQVSRGIQIAWSLLALAMLYLLGRRAFGEPAALVAVIVLATSPWFLLAASKFKPDVSLLATTLLALFLSARAAERPFSLAGYAAAGAAIAAAMSCKLTGGLTAVPFTVVSVIQAWRERRRFGGLVMAGVTSLVLYLAFNPHLRLYLNFMQRLTAEYEDKAKEYGGTHLGVLRRSLEMVVSDVGFGPIFGALGLLGFVGLGVLALRRDSPLRRPAPALVWLFAPCYLFAFAASTPHFKGNNVLSILPPLALFAGWLTVSAWRHLPTGLGPRVRSAARTLGLVVAVAGGAVQGAEVVTYAYQSVVPTTHDVARTWLRTDSGKQPMHLLGTRDPEQHYQWEGAFLGQPRLFARFPWAEAELAPERSVYDGVLGPADTVEASPWAPMPGIRVEPELFKARGPTVAARAQPWRRLGRPVQPQAEERDGRLYVQWPEELDVGWYSLEVWLPRRATRGMDPHVTVSEYLRPIAWLRAVGQGHLYSSPRFPYGPEQPPPRLEMAVPPAGSRAIAFALYRWQPPWHRPAAVAEKEAEPQSTPPADPGVATAGGR